MNDRLPRLAGLTLCVALALGSVAMASADGRGRSRCEINGPEMVLEGTTFRLCGPDDKRSYSWTGSGITGSSDRRCVSIAGLAPGTHTFALTFSTRRHGSTQTYSCSTEVTVISEAQICDIAAPTRVEPCGDFELCAPDLDGARFRWSGPGIRDDDERRRCVSIRGLAPGSYTYTLEVRVGGETLRCEFPVVVGDAVACLITGPTRVARDQSFRLCAPTGPGYTWSWDGRGIAGRDSQCVTVRGLDPGSYEFTLALDTPTSRELCTLEVTVVDSSATCFISGPATVLADESFELCAPAGYTYDWDGRGIRSDADDSSCVTIAGLDPGTYTYEVTLRNGAGRERCTFRVRVLESLLPALCPQPLRFWRQDCGRFTRDGFLTPFDFERVAACIDDRSDAFDWPNDSTALDSLLDGRSGGAYRTLRRQLLVLLANVCAADLGLLSPGGDSVGLRVGTTVSCGGEDLTIGELIDEVETFLATATRSERYQRRAARLVACLERINAGQGDEFACGVDRVRRGGHRDKKDDDLRAPGDGLARQIDGMSVQLERPSPNPFSASTRIYYEAPVGGGMVEIAVYDLAGRKVQQLASGRWEAGIHQVAWDGRDAGGGQVGPGVYFLRGRIGDRPVASRLMYVK